MYVAGYTSKGFLRYIMLGKVLEWLESVGPLGRGVGGIRGRRMSSQATVTDRVGKGQL